MKFILSSIFTIAILATCTGSVEYTNPESGVTARVGESIDYKQIKKLLNR